MISAAPETLGRVKMRALLLFGCLLVAPSAFAQQWVEVASGDDSTNLVDASSVRDLSQGYVQSWVLTNYAKFKPTIKGRSMKSLYRFKCDSTEYALSSYITYGGTDGSGAVAESYSESYPRYSPAAPETVGAALLEFTCAYSKGEEWAKRAALYGGIRQSVEAALQASQAVSEAAAAAGDAAAAATDAAAAAAKVTSEEDAISSAERAAGLRRPDIQTSSVSVVAVTLGSDIDESLQVLKPKAVFQPHDTIYVSIAIDNPKRESTRIGVRWTYEPTGQLVNTEHAELSGDVTAVSEFHISKPDGWPEGGYRLEVYVGGEMIQSLRLRVSR
jgi:hypothetical protein